MFRKMFGNIGHNKIRHAAEKNTEYEKYSPTIQYFMAKINNNGNFDDLETKALEFIKSIDFETSNAADKYFFQLQSNLFIEDNVRQGGSGGVSGMENQLLSFYEMEAIAYVRKLILNNNAENHGNSPSR